MPDRRVSVYLDAEVSSYKRKLAEAAAATSAFGKQVDGSGKEIDKLSGRLRLAADAAAVLGPALGPLGAAAVGGVVALSAQLGALAAGLGVTLLATKGLGDGLDALNKYQLDPSAANAEKLRHQLELLGPSGQRFVFFLDSITPQLQALQFAARDGLLPGAEDGIQHLLTLLPKLQSLVSKFSTEVGSLMSDSGEALAGEQFEAFFNYLDTDGTRILDDTARTIGNLTQAAANLFVAFGPLTGDFSGGLLEFSEGLKDASANLSSSQGFQEFLGYIQTTGPQALETIEALANALLQIVEAAAPLGGPVLQALEAVAKAIGAIADSDLGTPIFAGLAALALLNRSLAITASLSSATFGGPAVVRMREYVAGLATVTTAQQRAQMSATQMAEAEALAARNRQSTLASIGKGAAVIGALTLASSDYSQQSGLSNAASLAFAGSLAGPWGAAVGGGIGALLDLKGAYDGLNDSLAANETALASNNMAQLEQQIAATKAQLEDLQNTSTGEALGHGILGGFGLGPLADAQDEIGAVTGKTDDLNAQLAAMQERLAGLRDGTVSTFNPVERFGGALQKAAMAAQDEKAAIEGAIDAMHKMREEALRAQNAELDYQAAIDDATAAVRENGKTHDKTTEKGRANLRALYNLAGAWNGQSEVIKGNSKALAAARDNFIKVAGSMGISEGAARKLSRALFDIPEKRQTKITAETAEAEARIARIKAALAGLHDKTVHVTTVGTTVKAAGGALTGGPGSADGGTIPGPRQPYGDKMLYLLAPGEEVVSNRHGQADRHRALLKKINASRAADGDTVGGSPRSGSHSGDPISLFVAGTWSAAKALKALKAELEQSKKAVDRERQSRDDLLSQRSDFASQVGGAYSTMDPFAQASGSVWSQSGNPLAIFDAAVAGNTANTQAASAALAAAAANGLDGALYQALAGSGNLRLLQAFAGLSAAEIDAREKAFATQSAAQAGFGSQAAGAVFDARLKESNQHLQKIEDRLHTLQQAVKAASKETGDRVAAGVNGAASSGHRRGQR